MSASTRRDLVCVGSETLRCWVAVRVELDEELDHESAAAVAYRLAQIEREFAGRARLPLLRQVRLMGVSRSTALRCFIPSLVMFFQQWTGVCSNFHLSVYFQQKRGNARD